MANSVYDILETRIVFDGDNGTDLYVCITHPTDSLPIGGWYRKHLAPATANVLDVAQAAILKQEYLMLAREGWDYPCPPPENPSQFGLQGGHDVLVANLFALVSSLVAHPEQHHPNLHQVYGNLEIIKEASQKMADKEQGRQLYGLCLDLSLEFARKATVFHYGPEKTA